MKRLTTLLLAALTLVSQGDLSASYWGNEKNQVSAGSRSDYEMGSGWHGALLGGAAFVQNLDWYTHDSFEPAPFSQQPAQFFPFYGAGETRYKTGWMLGALLGYHWECGLALEGEVSYRRADGNVACLRTGICQDLWECLDEEPLEASPKQIEGAAIPFREGNLPYSGDASSLAFLLNIKYYLNMLDLFGWDTNLQPYFGLGFGVARVTIDGSISIDPLGPQFLRVNDSDWQLAYQAIVGFRSPIGERTYFFVEYHYFGVEDSTVKTERGQNECWPYPPTELRHEFKDHTLAGGIGIDF